MQEVLENILIEVRQVAKKVDDLEVKFEEQDKKMSHKLVEQDHRMDYLFQEQDRKSQAQLDQYNCATAEELRNILEVVRKKQNEQFEILTAKMNQVIIELHKINFATNQEYEKRFRKLEKRQEALEFDIQQLKRIIV